jgi:hypothetical protein
MKAVLQRLGAALLLALIAGCGQDDKPVLAPRDDSTPGNLSPLIEAVFPESRSAGVLYDTDIWVRFTEPLDPASVNERTVFFKLDTVRLPVSLTYDGATRTIHVVPLVQLALLRTYTVEITPAVETMGGQLLSQTSFWQFKTNGLRRLKDPAPPPGATGESPFALLQWGQTESSAGSIVYNVYQSPDSAAVAERSPVPLYSGSLPFMIPQRPWGLGARVYWAVTSVNRTSDEHLDGPVWSFDTLPPGFPVDSLVVPATEWGHFDLGLQRMSCLGSSISTGSNFNNGLHFPLAANAAGLKLARARLRVYATGTTYPSNPHPAVHSASEAWASCSYSPYIPKVGGKLADGARIGSSLYVFFESDAFTAFAEAGARYGLVHGFSLRASQNISYVSPLNFNGPRLVLYYYRMPHTPGAAEEP